MNELSGIKKLFIGFAVFLVLIAPIGAILLPISFLGNMFNNTWGTVESGFDMGYKGKFSEEVDKHVANTRTSINYKQLVACALADWSADPNECIDKLDTNGNINSESAEVEYLEVDFPEYHGTYDSSYFNKIHVLGKYTVSLYEKVGQHEEEITETVPDIQTGDVKEITKTVIVDDYDWVHYDEIKRGKCNNSDTQKCHIILEDRDVYPYQYVGAGIKDRYGLRTDENTFDINVEPNQKWRGSSLISFSKGEVLSTDGGNLKLKLLANNIDLIVTYEGVSSLFHEGEIVEATEPIGYADGEFIFYAQNSAGEYINPSLFFESVSRHYNGNFNISGIANYSIIANSPLGYSPNFNNAAAWRNAGDGGTNPYAYGQCTWFAYGVYYELYGHAPDVSGNGTSFASTLNEDGWTLNETLVPGSMVSATWLSDHPYGTVAIVGEIVDEDHMYIFHGNSNANLSADSWDTAIYDWSYQLVSTKGYTYSNGSFAAWDVASPPTDSGD